MFLIRPRHNRLSGTELLLVSGNVKQAFATKNKIDLIRFGVRVDTLILSGFQTIDVEKVFLGIKQGNLLHLLIRETDELLDISNFHCGFILEETLSRWGQFRAESIISIREVYRGS